MATYHVIFFTNWTIAAPIERVWQAIYNYEEWPKWWKYVDSVTKLTEGEGAAKISRFTWTTPLSYRISFDTKLTTVKPPHMLEFVATGDVEAEGLWQLKSVEGGTLVHHIWTVEITKRWMNPLSIFIRFLMNWNYDVIMREGGEALAKRLGTKLISVGKHQNKIA
ncbi:MAG TPA: SRPBCC family protein [Nostocaceae cyanobacterium]|nr:SRPBCC family protein [Nostocaceae cyanobacterium]